MPENSPARKPRPPRIRRCPEGHYSLKQKCPVCGKPTVLARPAAFSEKDKYQRERKEVLYS